MEAIGSGRADREGRVGARAGGARSKAVAGRCDAIVTYNLRDFEGIERFGIRAMTPQQILAQLRSKP